MARRFTSDGSANNAVSVTARGFTDWGFGTLAIVGYHVAAFDSAGRTLLTIGTVAQDFVEVFIGGDGGGGTNNKLDLWNGSASSRGVTVINSGGWYVWTVTKTTGTTTPRSHLYEWTSNTHTHENQNTTSANPTGTGATEHAVSFASAGTTFDGYVLAAAAWRSYTMTDSEVERLPRGLWTNYSPDLLIEFPSGRDNMNRTNIDNGRNRMLMKASGSQVTRGNITDPPGFRLSALNRRR